MKPLRVFDAPSGPGRWIAGDGALEAAPGAFDKIPQPLNVVGEFFLREMVRPRLLKPLDAAGYDLKEVDLASGAECCEGEIARVLETAAPGGSLVAVGGGKCMDIVKLAGQRSGRPVVTVPTSAATCACATTVAVLYDSQGVYLETVDMDEAPRLVLADTPLLASPAHLLAAGVIDAAAKWLEWSVLPPASRREFGAEAGWVTARRAWEIASQVKGDLSACKFDLETVLEASLLLSSTASCLGAAPAALAHSLCNGFSLLPACRKMSHGELVGLGLLVQDVVVAARGGKVEGADDRVAWLKGLGMPVLLPDGLHDADLAAVAEKSLKQGESALAMVPVPTAGEVTRALAQLAGAA